MFTIKIIYLLKLERNINTYRKLAERRISAIRTHRVNEIVWIRIVEAQQVLSRNVETDVLQTNLLNPCLRQGISQRQAVQRNACSAYTPERRSYRVNALVSEVRQTAVTISSDNKISLRSTFQNIGMLVNSRSSTPLPDLSIEPSRTS